MHTLTLWSIIIVTLLQRAAFAAQLICWCQQLSVAFSFSSQQCVKEWIHTRVSISQTCEDTIHCHLCAHWDCPQHVRLVERQQLPDPEGKKAGPKGQDNPQDEEQDFGFGSTRRTSIVVVSGPGWSCLWHPVKATQCCIKCSDGQPGTENASAEKHTQIGFGALLIPCWDAQLALLVIPIFQVQCDHHGQAESHR